MDAKLQDVVGVDLFMFEAAALRQSRNVPASRRFGCGVPRRFWLGANLALQGGIR